MRKRHGGRTNWYEILADPVDRGHVWVLDTVDRRWLVVPVANARTAKGLNKFAMKVVMRMARKIAPKGEKITDAIMEEARERCDREALTAHTRSALRYVSDGALPTPVLGNNNILAVLAGAILPMPDADDGLGEQSAINQETPEQPATSDGPQTPRTHFVKAVVKQLPQPKLVSEIAINPKDPPSVAPCLFHRQEGPSALDLLIARGASSRKSLL